MDPTDEKKIYDQNADQRHDPTAQANGGHTNGGGVGRDDLRNAEQQGGFYNEDGDEGAGQDSKSESAGSLKNSEGSGQQGSLFNAGGDQSNRRQKIQSTVSKLAKNKWLVGGIGVSGGGIIILILLLLLFLGNFKIVDFAEHVAAYQFARNTSQMAEDSDQITAEKIGVDSADTGVYNSLKARYGDATGKVSDLWSKLDKYRPNQIIQNFDDEGTMQFNYEDGSFGRQVLKGVTINGENVGIESNPVKDRLVPGYKFVTKDVSVSRTFAPELTSALKANNIGPITRARVASQVRKELDISLTAWVIGKFAGKPEAEANAAQEQLSFDIAEGSQNTVASIGSDQLDSAAQNASDAEKAAVNNPDQIKDIVKDPNQLPLAVQDSLDNSLKESAMSISGAAGAVLGFVNPFYKIAVPLCLVYDGSLSNKQAGGVIDQQNAQTERGSGVWVQSAAAQLKDGHSANGEAAGAGAWKLGDITQSNAEKRASGIPVNTSDYASTEASPTGQYSIADVGLPSPLNDVVNTFGGACPALTNLWVAAGVAGGNIAITAITSLLTGGVGGEGIVGGEAAAETAADEAVPSLASRLVGKAIDGGSSAKGFVKDTAKSATLIAAATLIAKSIVLSQMGSTHSSLSTGKPFDDSADSSTNVYANQVEQQQFYGAPMTDKDLGPDNSDNMNYLADQQAQKSAFERYASIHNPDSLLSRAALTAGSYLSTTSLRSLPNLAGALLNPIRSFGSVLSPLINHTSFADANVTSANTYYGNVQFGYTRAEKNLMKNDASYSLLANQQILDSSGNEDAIGAKYGKCFDGSESIGTMLVNGDIQRDNNGDVLPDKGLCAPDNLTYTNNEFGPQMVFRFRVANNYENAFDQLGQMQEVTASDTTGSTTTSSDCTAPAGNAKILCEAKKYNGIYYLGGGGHQPFASFQRGCSSSNLSSAASTSTSGTPGPCATDCSGLVSVAVDGAFGQNFSWIVSNSNGTMQGSGAQFWKSIPINQVQPGDIVTTTVPDGHVEIVDKVSGGTFTTFGSHSPGEKTSEANIPASYWKTGAFRYTGPGSSP